MLSVDERLKLIKGVGEEIIQEDELKELLKSNKPLIAYDGFEPSGQIHIAQGLLRAINVNKMTKAGVKFKMLVADWHAMANNKLDGDLNKIQTVGKYFIEVWRASGMDLSNVEFIWASDLVKDSDYWMLVLRIARTNKLARFIRTAQIMGREESSEKLSAAQIIYPCMQVADIFTLGAHITQLGMDQRKVNMLAREVGLQLGFWKPVVVSHHMLLSLRPPIKLVGEKKDMTLELKMSKSKPDSSIFMTDSTEDIRRKINKSYCPEGVVEMNPILEYCRYIIFESFDRLGVDEFTVERPERFGGKISFRTYKDLENTFVRKELHPMDLKNAVAQALNKLIEPVRHHFKENTEAYKLEQEVKKFKVTR